MEFVRCSGIEQEDSLLKSPVSSTAGLLFLGVLKGPVMSFYVHYMCHWKPIRLTLVILHGLDVCHFII